MISPSRTTRRLQSPRLAIRRVEWCSSAKRQVDDPCIPCALAQMSSLRLLPRHTSFRKHERHFSNPRCIISTGLSFRRVRPEGSPAASSRLILAVIRILPEKNFSAHASPVPFSASRYSSLPSHHRRISAWQKWVNKRDHLPASAPPLPDRAQPPTPSATHIPSDRAK